MQSASTYFLTFFSDNRYANSLCTQSTKKLLKKFANEIQGQVGNLAVLFSYCVKKKATLEEVQNKEIRTSLRDKTVRVSNFVVPNSHI